MGPKFEGLPLSIVYSYSREVEGDEKVGCMTVFVRSESTSANLNAITLNISARHVTQYHQTYGCKTNIASDVPTITDRFHNPTLIVEGRYAE